MTSMALWKSRVFLLSSLAIIITGLLLLGSITIFNHNSLPVLGKDSLVHLKPIENHKSALAHWLSSGIKNAVLVNIDAHDDIKRMPEIYIQELQGQPARKTSATNAVEEDYRNFSDKVTNGNFIYAAAKIGLFKEVYWIIPAPIMLEKNRVELLVSLLDYYNFLRKDIKTFKMEGNCFKGLVNNIPLNICGLEALPDIDRPIILSIDTDFFPVAADSYNEKLIKSVHRTYKTLAAKGYQIENAAIAYSIDGGHLNTYHRWIGDLLIELLKSPGTVSEENMPNRYHALQQAEHLLMMGRNDDLFDHLLPYIERKTPDPAMLIYQAFALDSAGAEAHAYSFAEQACLADRNYCYGLCEIGGNLLPDHGLASAEKFFMRGYRLHPQMAFGQFTLAQAMLKNGRFDEAINYFMEFRKFNGSFPVDFYLGKTLMLMGDDTNAMTFFESARTELLKNPPAAADLGDVNIVMEAIEFYRRKGLTRIVNELQVTLAMRDKYRSDRPTLIP